MLDYVIVFRERRSLSQKVSRARRRFADFAKGVQK